MTAVATIPGVIRFSLSDVQDKVALCEGEAVTFLVGSDRKSGRSKAIDVRRSTR